MAFETQSQKSALLDFTHEAFRSAAVNFRNESAVNFAAQGYADVLAGPVSVSAVEGVKRLSFPFIATLLQDAERLWGFGLVVEGENFIRFIGFSSSQVQFISLMRSLDLLHAHKEIHNYVLEEAGRYTGLLVNDDLPCQRIQDNLGGGELRLTWKPKLPLKFELGLEKWLDAGREVDLLEVLDFLSSNPGVVGPDLTQRISALARGQCIDYGLSRDYFRVYWSVAPFLRELGGDDLTGAGVFSGGSETFEISSWQPSTSDFGEQAFDSRLRPISAQILQDDAPSILTEESLIGKLEKYGKAFEEFYLLVRKPLDGFLTKLELLSRSTAPHFTALHDLTLIASTLQDLAVGDTNEVDQLLLFGSRIETLVYFDMQLVKFPAEAANHFKRAGEGMSARDLWEMQDCASRFRLNLNRAAYTAMSEMYRLGEYSYILDR